MDSIASLVLPYIDSERTWILLAARTSKALSAHLVHHWEDRYRQLLADLRSCRARFEITRYVSCHMRDPFYWGEDDTLDAWFFTVSILKPQSFARQAVPQIQQALCMMENWEGDAEYTASEEIPSMPTAPCKVFYPIGSIPIRVAYTPTPLLTGSLEQLSEWLETPHFDEGYSTDESWECDCGETHTVHDDDFF